MNKQVVVIGAGVAGLTVAGALAEQNIKVVLIEKESQTGGHVRNWDRLFPSRRHGSEVMDFLDANISEQVDIRRGVSVSSIVRVQNGFKVILANHDEIDAACLILSTGFQLFNAAKKEEYGYGIYDNVITSAELESIFKSGAAITTKSGKTPERVAFIHCVGSRDEKVGNLYCSKVCCVTGVKQAIEIREILPHCEVFSFYMDLRMYDRNFEELYYEAQQKWGVNFIRGRLSECAENPDHSLIIKTEDTLTGKPLKMTVDLVVLLVGFTPSAGTDEIVKILALKTGQDGFVASADEHFLDNNTDIPGVFVTGALKGPACIVNTIADARATAQQVGKYLITLKTG